MRACAGLTTSRLRELSGWVRSVQAAVGAMLETLQHYLIEGRQPQQRLVAVLDQFTDHPDVKRVMDLRAHCARGADSQELSTHVLDPDQLKLAINVHKSQRNRDSQRL